VCCTSTVPIGGGGQGRAHGNLGSSSPHFVGICRSFTNRKPTVVSHRQPRKKLELAYCIYRTLSFSMAVKQINCAGTATWAERRDPRLSSHLRLAGHRKGSDERYPGLCVGDGSKSTEKLAGGGHRMMGGCAEFAGALPKIVTKSCRHACDCAKVVRSRWRHPSNGRRRAAQCTKCRPRPDLRSPLPPHVGASRDPGDGDVCCMHGVGFAGGGREESTA
jgi:hypothetical protein